MIVQCDRNYDMVFVLFVWSNAIAWCNIIQTNEFGCLLLKHMISKYKLRDVWETNKIISLCV